MDFPASCGRWRCQLHPVQFPVPATVLSAPQAPARTLGALRKQALRVPPVVASDCCSVLSSSAAGRDWSLAAASCRIEKVAQRWGIDLRKGKVTGSFTYLLIVSGKFSLCVFNDATYELAEDAAATIHHFHCSRFPSQINVDCRLSN